MWPSVRVMSSVGTSGLGSECCRQVKTFLQRKMTKSVISKFPIWHMFTSSYTLSLCASWVNQTAIQFQKRVETHSRQMLKKCKCICPSKMHTKYTVLLSSVTTSWSAPWPVPVTMAAKVTLKLAIIFHVSLKQFPHKINHWMICVGEGVLWVWAHENDTKASTAPTNYNYTFHSLNTHCFFSTYISSSLTINLSMLYILYIDMYMNTVHAYTPHIHLCI